MSGSSSIDAANREVSEFFADVGRRVRSVRLERELSIAQLGEKSGLSAGLISQFERGKSGISVANFRRICVALDVSIATFLAEEPEGMASASASDMAIVVRKGRRRRIPYSGSEIVLELLSSDPNARMEVLWTSATPGAHSGDEAHSHIGEECWFVQQGVLEIAVAGKVHILEAGDAIYFDSELPHRWRSIGEEELQTVGVATPRSF